MRCSKLTITKQRCIGIFCVVPRQTDLTQTLHTYLSLVYEIPNAKKICYKKKRKLSTKQGAIMMYQ